MHCLTDAGFAISVQRVSTITETMVNANSVHAAVGTRPHR